MARIRSQRRGGAVGSVLGGVTCVCGSGVSVEPGGFGKFIRSRITNGIQAVITI